MPTVWRPTPQQLQQARGKVLSDLIRPDLKVLFCGINPGLYSAAIGHHFGRPGNRFWPALHLAGFTSRRLSPFDEAELLGLDLGITNIVRRATASAAELSGQELRRGTKMLIRKVQEYRPQWLAVLGIGAYRAGFGNKHAGLGEQSETFGSTGVWLLPNPSGLNAHHSLSDLAKLFAELRRRVR